MCGCLWKEIVVFGLVGFLKGIERLGIFGFYFECWWFLNEFFVLSGVNVGKIFR